MRSPYRLFAALPLALTLTAVPAMFAGCASDEGASALGGDERTSEIQAELTKAERTTRYTKIKAAAANGGIPNNAYMLAGIAYSETGLAHCWSEATWACKGPNSVDCSNGPVIAGAGDGPCADEQGGLGMFQFDAGTYAQTLSKYSSDVLTIAGNVSHAIDYVINMVKVSTYTTNAETDAKALAWINNFDPSNATLRDQWVKTVTHYYNGCKPTYSCWSQRYKHYDDGLQYVIDDTGLAFWKTAIPDWKASYVSQSFPLASKPFVLTPGQTQTGYIELRNDGAATWEPGEVFLATSEPRDGASPLAGLDWSTPSRAASVEATTAPGQSAKFTFTVKAPNQLGDYPQYFNLVREGVAWFSDDGQGGPPDNQLQIKLTVEAGTCPGGLGDAWVCDGQKRVRCEPSTGAVFEELCAELCADTDAGAACVSSEGEGGSAGSAGGPNAEGGHAGEAGSAGQAGTGGNAGDAGEAGSAGTSAAGSAGSQSGEDDPPASIIVQQSDTEQQSGCSASRGNHPGATGWLLGLAALATGSRLRRRQRLSGIAARSGAAHTFSMPPLPSRPVGRQSRTAMSTRNVSTSWPPE